MLKAPWLEVWTNDGGVEDLVDAIQEAEGAQDGGGLAEDLGSFRGSGGQAPNLDEDCCLHFAHVITYA